MGSLDKPAPASRALLYASLLRRTATASLSRIPATSLLTRTFLVATKQAQSEPDSVTRLDVPAYAGKVDYAPQDCCSPHLEPGCSSKAVAAKVRFCRRSGCL